MDILASFPCDAWRGPFGQSDYGGALEAGRVLFFPQLGFRLLPSEHALLSPDLSGGRGKNISLDPSRTLDNARLSDEDRPVLQAMMERFANSADAFLRELLPEYAPTLERARTSFRPVEVAGRRCSRSNDDTLLHVDAFPARPLQGRRILRLFSNIHPGHVPRVWNVGEPFAEMAAKLLPRVKEPVALTPRFLAAIGATRGVRSAYDSLMLGLHDRAKHDADYQARTTRTELQFPPGSTWLCFTDQVMHAVLSGQFMLEQTFHLDVEAMAEPARSPIRVLETILGRRLA
jgi:3-deoxy-D-manno-oct-2-ulosonic acid (Kdo) hydroxylase